MQPWDRRGKEIVTSLELSVYPPHLGKRNCYSNIGPQTRTTLVPLSLAFSIHVLLIWKSIHSFIHSIIYYVPSTLQWMQHKNPCIHGTCTLKGKECDEHYNYSICILETGKYWWKNGARKMRNFRGRAAFSKFLLKYNIHIGKDTYH